jgi:hypothetical protein
MKKITIERYPVTPRFTLPDGTEVTSVTDFCSGLIEGVRDDGSSWIMFLDADGSPEVFWALREEDGAVIGDPILLQPDQASAP